MGKIADHARLVLLASTNKSKYVNMTDINSPICSPADRTLKDGKSGLTCPSGEAADEHIFWYIEAFFFAYRDLVSDPDRLLNEIGFGRAHHRVLHFVNRYPGMRVADLLEILQITKQSLARVLRELIKEGYIHQRSGEADRRERLLFVTPRGRELAGQLAAPQVKKMRDVLNALGEDRSLAAAKFLEDMISGAGRLPAMRRGRADGSQTG
jgi:DNA-binding MarR family transcriptional regulator